jgi:molybdopterin-containing oxidoreductase family iron-sulfur binding subunit
VELWRNVLCVSNDTNGLILKLKKDGRTVKDGEFAAACSCSNGAIKFGDINDKESEIFFALKQQDRMYLIRGRRDLM